MSPVLVVGPGRSGTSVVAELLHRRGVSMGRRFESPPPANPRGTWEDLDFRDLHVAYHRGEITLRDLRIQIMALDASRREPWGLKDPRLTHHVGLYLSWLSPPVGIVYCHRDPAVVVKSLRRHYHTPLDQAQAQTRTRILMCRRLLNAVRYERRLELDMNRHRSQAWLWERLEAFLALLYAPHPKGSDHDRDGTDRVAGLRDREPERGLGGLPEGNGGA